MQGTVDFGIFLIFFLCMLLAVLTYLLYRTCVAPFSQESDIPKNAFENASLLNDSSSNNPRCKEPASSTSDLESSPSPPNTGNRREKQRSRRAMKED